MRVWLFQFTDQQCPMQSARVAADDRSLACSLMQSVLDQVGIEIVLDGTKPRPAGAVVLSFLAFQQVEPGVLSCQMRNGRSLEAEAAR